MTNRILALLAATAFSLIAWWLILLLVACLL